MNISQQLSVNKLFPVSLILNERSCLIVGGGKIATRKLIKLLSTDARITIIAPVVSDFILEQAKLGKIALFVRKFQKADIKEFFLVFAATDSKEVNNKIVKLCNKKKILCCAIDRNWEKGSFITSASFAKEDFVISISSSGKKCKKSKQIKNFIKSSLDKVNVNKLFKD